MADDDLLRRQGQRRFVRQGGYTSQGSLDADIRAYALS